MAAAASAVVVVDAAAAAVDAGAVVAPVAAATDRVHRDHLVVPAAVVWPPHSAALPPVPAPPRQRVWPS